MSKSHSSAAIPQSKPAKPYADFPLFAHATKRWAKKIRGKMHYFGSWDDPDAALAKYLEQKDALHAGRKPKDVDTSAGVSIKDLCNKFWKAKKQAMEVGELSPRTFKDYETTTDLIAKHFGKARLLADIDVDDFAALRNKMAKQWGPVTLGNTIQRIRVVFKFAYDSGLIDRPIRYGPGFKRPSKKTLRLDKAKQGVKLFTAEEVRRMLGCPPWRAAAGVQLRAMILLGINCGFGNADCGTLPITALDLDGGWVTFPRPKTGIARRCKLWPETVQALRDVLAERKEPKDADAAGLVFVTKYGNAWGKDIADSPVTKETRKLLDSLGINGHRNFYVLRHSFRTVADNCKDQPAIDHIMGHESAHMSSVYRETISDERLQAVTDHVRQWLFGVA